MTTFGLKRMPYVVHAFHILLAPLIRYELIPFYFRSSALLPSTKVGFSQPFRLTPCPTRRLRGVHYVPSKSSTDLHGSHFRLSLHIKNMYHSHQYPDAKQVEGG